jgi:hypothetical protein
MRRAAAIARHVAAHRQPASSSPSSSDNVSVATGTEELQSFAPETLLAPLGALLDRQLITFGAEVRGYDLKRLGTATETVSLHTSLCFVHVSIQSQFPELRMLCGVTNRKQRRSSSY